MSDEKKSKNEDLTTSESISSNELAKFETDLKDFSDKLEKLDFAINKADEFINEECTELRRVIQLDTEELIAAIKQSNDLDVNLDDSQLDPDLSAQINDLKTENELLITQIDQYEKKSIDLLTNNNKSKKILIKDVNKLKQAANVFIKYWSKLLIYEPDLNATEVSEACQMLKKYQLRLDFFVDKIKMFIFDNNLLILKKIPEATKSNQLSYCIYFKQFHIFDPAKCFELKSIEKEIYNNFLQSKEKTIARHLTFECEKLDNGTYLIAATFLRWKRTTFLIIDPILNKIEHRLDLDCFCVTSLSVNKSLIALSCIQGDHSSEAIIILNNELVQLYNKTTNCLEVVGVDDSFIYCVNLNKKDTIDVLNWSLEEINNIPFQYDDPDAVFYIPNDEFITQLQSRDNKYYVKPSFIDSILVFSTDGLLLRTIHISGFKEFKIDKNNDLIALSLKQNKLFYYNLNGKPLKEIELIDIDNCFKELSEARLIIDKESKAIFYNFKDLIFFY